MDGLHCFEHESGRATAGPIVAQPLQHRRDIRCHIALQRIAILHRVLYVLDRCRFVMIQFTFGIVQYLAQVSCGRDDCLSVGVMKLRTVGSCDSKRQPFYARIVVTETPIGRVICPYQHPYFAQLPAV